MVQGSKDELVDFIVHRAFYPVLMVDRAGSNKAVVEQLQEAARAEVEKFRRCRSVGEVVISFNRHLGARSASDSHGKLRLLHLSIVHDFRDDFERKDGSRSFSYQKTRSNSSETDTVTLERELLQR